MRLSKRIPARTKTVKFNWCRKEWLKMSDQYRAVRSKCASPMDACGWCGHKFKNGEMMALAKPEKSANMVLCNDCADECLSSVEGLEL